MNRYEGVNCPVCNKPFTEDDLVTVCPICGTPHHMDCYRELGKCAHEDWHETGRKFSFDEDTKPHTHAEHKQESASHFQNEADDRFDDADTNEAETEEDENVCPRCKAPYAPNAMFCQQCGFPVGQFRRNMNNGQNPYGAQMHQAGPFVYGSFPMRPFAGMNPDEELHEGITVREYAAFIGPASNQFLLRFKRMAATGRTVSWNLLFALGNAFYFSYRKVYKLAIPLLIYLGIFLGLYLSCSLMSVSAVMGQLSTELVSNMDSIYMMLQNAMAQLPPILLRAYSAVEFTLLPLIIILGLFGDRIYFNHCTRRIKAIKEAAGEGADVTQTLAQQGGANRKLTRILLLIVLLAFMVMPFITAFML